MIMRIRSGETGSIFMEHGKEYQIRFARGLTWYGPELLFGLFNSSYDASRTRASDAINGSTFPVNHDGVSVEYIGFGNF